MMDTDTSISDFEYFKGNNQGEAKPLSHRIVDNPQLDSNVNLHPIA